jgi:hypothetical protein
MTLHEAPIVLEWRGIDGRPLRPWSATRIGAVLPGGLLLMAAVLIVVVAVLVSAVAGIDLTDLTHWPRLRGLMEQLAVGKRWPPPRGRAGSSR